MCFNLTNQNDQYSIYLFISNSYSYQTTLNEDIIAMIHNFIEPEL